MPSGNGKPHWPIVWFRLHCLVRAARSDDALVHWSLYCKRSVAISRRSNPGSPGVGRTTEPRSFAGDGAMLFLAFEASSGARGRCPSPWRPNPPVARQRTRCFVLFVPSWWKIADIAEDILPIPGVPRDRTATGRGSAISTTKTRRTRSGGSTPSADADGQGSRPLTSRPCSKPSVAPSSVPD
jgi:hypothetical protein